MRIKSTLKVLAIAAGVAGMMSMSGVSSAAEIDKRPGEGDEQVEPILDNRGGAADSGECQGEGSQRRRQTEQAPHRGRSSHENLLRPAVTRQSRAVSGLAEGCSEMGPSDRDPAWPPTALQSRWGSDNPHTLPVGESCNFHTSSHKQ